MRSPRHATVAHVLDSLEGGGTERQLVSLLGAMADGPVRHVVVTIRDAGSLAAQLPGSVACRPLAITRSGSAFLPLSRVLREVRADIVHARNTGTWFDATVAARLARVRALVLGFHGLDTGDTFSTRQIRKARIGSLAGAHFTTVGRAGAEALQHQAAINERRISVLPNGVDLDLFRPRSRDRAESIRAALGFSPDDVVIGSVGSLSPVKRFDRLLEAAGLLRDRGRQVRVLLAGQGPLRGALQAQAAARGLADRLLLAGLRSDIPDVLAAMDVFVSSSASEGMSNAVLEALAAGRPVVTTPVGEHATLIRDRVDGLLARDGTPEALADAIATIIDDPDTAHHLRSAARTRAAEFALDRAAAGYVRFYERLLNRKGRFTVDEPSPVGATSTIHA